MPGESWLTNEECREWIYPKYGEDVREPNGEDGEESRDWKRRSKGRWEGLGLGRSASRLLLGEERREPCGDQRGTSKTERRDAITCRDGVSSGVEAVSSILPRNSSGRGDDDRSTGGASSTPAV